MKTPAQLKQPSTYAGLGVIFSAIPALLATGGTDMTAWAAIIGGIIAIFKNEGSTVSA